MSEPQEDVIIGNYLLTEEGRLLVFQKVRCRNCLSWGDVYIDMSRVEGDIIQDTACPECGETEIEIVTFKEQT